MIEHDGRWYMLYTGISRSEGGLDPAHRARRLGRPHPLDEASGEPGARGRQRWYDLLDLTRWRDQSWRDPWLFVDADDGSFHVPDHGAVAGRRRRRRRGGRPRPLARPRRLGGAAAADRARRLRPGRVPAARPARRTLRHPLLVPRPRITRGARTNGSGRRGDRARSSSRQTSSTARTRRAHAPIAAPDGQLGPLYAGKLVESEPGELGVHGVPRRRRPRLRRRADRPASRPARRPTATLRIVAERPRSDEP